MRELGDEGIGGIPPLSPSLHLPVTLGSPCLPVALSPRPVVLSAAEVSAAPNSAGNDSSTASNSGGSSIPCSALAFPASPDGGNTAVAGKETWGLGGLGGQGDEGTWGQGDIPPIAPSPHLPIPSVPSSPCPERPPLALFPPDSLAHSSLVFSDSLTSPRSASESVILSSALCTAICAAHVAEGSSVGGLGDLEIWGGGDIPPLALSPRPPVPSAFFIPARERCRAKSATGFPPEGTETWGLGEEGMRGNSPARPVSPSPCLPGDDENSRKSAFATWTESAGRAAVATANGKDDFINLGLRMDWMENRLAPAKRRRRRSKHLLPFLILRPLRRFAGHLAQPSQHGRNRRAAQQSQRPMGRMIS